MLYLIPGRGSVAVYGWVDRTGTSYITVYSIAVVSRREQVWIASLKDYIRESPKPGGRNFGFVFFWQTYPGNLYVLYGP